MKQLNELLKIKNKINASKKKCLTLKTKNAREKQWDIQRSLRRHFADIAEPFFNEIVLNDSIFKSLSVSHPISSEYHVLNAENFKIETNYGTSLQVSFNIKDDTTRYAGYIKLLDRTAIKNLEKIIELLDNKKAA